MIVIVYSTRQDIVPLTNYNLSTFHLYHSQSCCGGIEKHTYLQEASVYNHQNCNRVKLERR